MNVVQRAEKDIKVHIRNCESPFQYPGLQYWQRDSSPLFNIQDITLETKIQGERGSLIKTFVKY